MVDGPFFSNLLESIRLHQTNASYCSIERNAMEHLLLSLLDCVSNQRDKATLLLLATAAAERLSRKTPLQKPLFSWSWWFLIQQYLPATKLAPLGPLLPSSGKPQKNRNCVTISLYMSSTVFYALSNYTQEWNLLGWKMIYLSRRL